MRFALSAATFVAALLAATAAAAQPAATCAAPQQSRHVAQLLFGRDVGGRLGVSQAAWSKFVAREVTPRFPDGLTVVDAVGQWRDRASGRIAREPSKLVEIVLPGGADDAARLQAVAAAYRRQFHQQSVAIVVQAACVSF